MNDTNNDQTKPVFTCGDSLIGRTPTRGKYIYENGEVIAFVASYMSETHHWADRFVELLNATNNAAKPKPFYADASGVLRQGDGQYVSQSTDVENAKNRAKQLNTYLNLTADEPDGFAGCTSEASGDDGFEDEGKKTVFFNCASNGRHISGFDGTPNPEPWEGAPEGVSIRVRSEGKDQTLYLKDIHKVWNYLNGAEIISHEAKRRMVEETPDEIRDLCRKAIAEAETETLPASALTTGLLININERLEALETMLPEIREGFKELAAVRRLLSAIRGSGTDERADDGTK